MRRDFLTSSKKTRRKGLILKSVLFSFLLIFIFSGLSWLSHRAKIRIQKISIMGNSTLGNEEIMSNVISSINGKYLFLFPYDNILIIPVLKIKNTLLNDISRIKEVSLNRNFPNTLLVEIKERELIALFCKEEESALLVSKSALCFYIDEDGFIFEKAPYFSGNVYLKFFDEREKENKVEVKENIVSQEQFKKLMDFKKFVLKENIKITRIILKKEGIYNLYTDEGWYFLINEKNESSLSAENLKILLNTNIKEKQKELDYIDLRFGNKLYFKFK